MIIILIIFYYLTFSSKVKNLFRKTYGQPQKCHTMKPSPFPEFQRSKLGLQLETRLC